MSWLVWSYQIVCLQLVLFHTMSCANLCSHDQSSALLHFKQHFRNGFSNSKTNYWQEDTDCCSWEGVTCDMATGHVIELDLSSSGLFGRFPSNSSLFLLSHLQKLNLAFNFFLYSPIPSDFAQFSSLTHLNLAGSYFYGLVPFEISRLSKLVSLDLGGLGNSLTLETHVMKGLVQNLTELEELSLDYVNMSTVPPSCLTNLSFSLTLLSLHDCHLQGSFPVNIFHLPSLHTLDLQSNSNLSLASPKVNWSSALMYLDASFTALSGKLPDSMGNLKFLSHLGMINCNMIGSIPASIGNLTQLSFLDLHYNNFNGSIPASIGNLTQLSFLDLHSNNFSGNIPSSFSNLKQLTMLDLSYNNFIGEIPDIFVNLTQLFSLSLQGNSLFGPIPSSVGRLQKLAAIFLSNNSLNGTIPSGLFQINSLQKIDLRDNRLQGPIASSISGLNLTSLSLSSNNLSGKVELDMFAKLMYLEHLDLSYSGVSLIIQNKVNSSFPRLQTLALSSCNINQFPMISSNDLRSLDLSNNKIHGHIPSWLFNKTSLYSLILSGNFLTRIEQFPWQYLSYLDLRSNLLQGVLPAPPPSLMVFSVSHNNLTGAIPSSFCNLTRMLHMELSNNSFYGVIPQCLGNLSFTWVLDLKMNYFHGSIPHTFTNGSSLRTLNLNSNQLEGPLPPSLVNCGNLEVLDLGNNMINDTFPQWLATLPQLQVLVLRSNRFHGPLVNSMTRIPFPNLRIFDISHNRFTGHLRMRFFKKFRALMRGKNNGADMRYMGNEIYQDSMMVTMKGVEIQMQRILTIFTTMDLSCNKLQGQISETVGKLNSLKVLNFSYNSLTGHIPISLKNLTELESLDLSSNELNGEIPKQLTSLTSLSVLNLSYNQLEGPIPLGPQFNTFQTNSYLGNLGLCGPPLSKTCVNDSSPEPNLTKFQRGQNTSSWFDWKIIMMGYGSGIVIGLSMGYIVFSTGKPWWFVSMVERKALKLSERHKRGRRRRN